MQRGEMISFQQAAKRANGCNNNQMPVVEQFTAVSLGMSCVRSHLASFFIIHP